MKEYKNIDELRKIFNIKAEESIRDSKSVFWIMQAVEIFNFLVNEAQKERLSITDFEKSLKNINTFKRASFPGFNQFNEESMEKIMFVCNQLCQDGLN